MSVNSKVILFRVPTGITGDTQSLVTQVGVTYNGTNDRAWASFGGAQGQGENGGPAAAERPSPWVPREAGVMQPGGREPCRPGRPRGAPIWRDQEQAPHPHVPRAPLSGHSSMLGEACLGWCPRGQQPRAQNEAARGLNSVWWTRGA